MRTVNWKKLSWWVGALVLLATLAAPDLAADQDSVKVRVQEPFEFNGEVFGPGSVMVRELSHYNPTTTLGEVWVNDRCLGVMLADVNLRSSGLATEDRVLFKRSAAGHLVLVGFAYRNQTARSFYGYETVATGGRWSTPSELSTEMESVAVALQN